MACSIIRYPLLRNSSVRYYAAAATTQCRPSLSENVKVLGNKITIAALDNNNPITQVSVIFRASSRHETYETQGVSHMLRICSGLTTCRSSTFAITRNIQQFGGQLITSSDREYISYTLNITRNNLGSVLKFLEDVAIYQLFRPWEISDQIPRLRYEVSSMSNNVRIIELLYKAAYHDGLGNSLYCPKRKIGKIGAETLSHFISNYYTGPRCAVVGTGLPLSEIELFASSFNVSSTDCADTSTVYYGGEIRKERNHDFATVAVAVPGSSISNRKDAIAFAVLQKIAGDGPKVKWGENHGLLSKAIACLTQDSFAINAINISHSDSGLFGFILSAPSEIAGTLLNAGINWLRSPKFEDNDVEIGKTNLKAAVLADADRNYNVINTFGYQLLYSNNILTADNIVAEIDEICAADVQNVASQLCQEKLTIVSIGNLSTIPRIDQL